MTRTVELEPSGSEYVSTGSPILSDSPKIYSVDAVRKYDLSLSKNKDLQKNSPSACEIKRTSEMTNFMDDLSLNSPKERQSRSRSKTHSYKRKSSRSSSDSSSDSCSSSSSCSRSRSCSRDRKYRHKTSRRSSRSYSRSHSRSYSRDRSRSYSIDRSRSYSRDRSRSYSPRHRRRYSPAYRRYYRSPPRYRSRSRMGSVYSSCYYRSRSRSRMGSVYSSRYSRSRSRSCGRKYYGFVRRPYSPTFRSWRSRSRTHSRSRTPLRLSEKEKQELLEIAKKNASKVLGKEVELPESLRKEKNTSKTLEG